MQIDVFQEFGFLFLKEEYDEFRVNKTLFWDDFIDRVNKELKNMGVDLSFRHFTLIPLDYIIYLNTHTSAILPLKLFKVLENKMIEMTFHDEISDKLNFVLRLYDLVNRIKVFLFMAINNPGSDGVLFFHEKFEHIYTAHTLLKKEYGRQ